MATFPMPNPQGAAPQPGAAPQANPLQTTLAKVAMILRQLGSQNQIISDNMTNAAQQCIEALQKVSQASSGPPQQPPAPPQGA